VVRVVVVAAEGPHFSRRGDLAWVGQLTEADAARLMRLNAHLGSELRHGSQPIIGAARPGASVAATSCS
jgi:enoyl-CoA hydratase/carnithine racemase